MSAPQEAFPAHLPPWAIAPFVACLSPCFQHFSAHAVFIYLHLCPAHNLGQGPRGPQCCAWHRCLLNECPAVLSLLPEARLELEKPAEAPRAGLSRWVFLEQCFVPVSPQDCRSQSCPLPPARWPKLWGGRGCPWPLWKAGLMTS